MTADERPFPVIARNTDTAIGYRLRCSACRWDVTNTWGEHRCAARVARGTPDGQG